MNVAELVHFFQRYPVSGIYLFPWYLETARQAFSIQFDTDSDGAR